jgi:hypothetical protein
MNVLGPSVLDLHSLLHNVNSLFLCNSDESIGSASKCISIKFSGGTYVFQGAAGFEVLNSGIAGDFFSFFLLDQQSEFELCYELMCWLLNGTQEMHPVIHLLCKFNHSSDWVWLLIHEVSRLHTTTRHRR